MSQALWPAPRSRRSFRPFRRDPVWPSKQLTAAGDGSQQKGGWVRGSVALEGSPGPSKGQPWGGPRTGCAVGRRLPQSPRGCCWGSRQLGVWGPVCSPENGISDFNNRQTIYQSLVIAVMVAIMRVLALGKSCLFDFWKKRKIYLGITLYFTSCLVLNTCSLALSFNSIEKLSFNLKKKSFILWRIYSSY